MCHIWKGARNRMSEAIKLEDNLVVLEPREGAPSPREEKESVFRAEAYLSRYSRMNQRIEQKLRFMAQLREFSTCVSPDPDAPAGDGPGEGPAETVARMIDLEKEIDRDIDHLVDLENEIWTVLGMLDNPEAALMLDRVYLRGERVSQAAEGIGYSVRYGYKLRRWALLQVDRILREERPMVGYVSPV